jgi:hypothetical protein
MTLQVINDLMHTLLIVPPYPLGNFPLYELIVGQLVIDITISTRNGSQLHNNGTIEKKKGEVQCQQPNTIT